MYVVSHNKHTYKFCIENLLRCGECKIIESWKWITSLVTKLKLKLWDTDIHFKGEYFFKPVATILLNTKTHHINGERFKTYNRTDGTVA